jgi:hypothetical protein
MGRLFLREQGGINELLKIVAANDLAIDPQAIEYASHSLSDDWLTLSDAGGPNCFCDLSIGKKGGLGYSLPQWIDVVTSLYQLREVRDIDEQARRLCLTTHERLDTALALIVAARYRRRGWAVMFEPNGEGCSDLRVAQGDRHFYIEVKRENTQDHVRLRNIHNNSYALSRDVYSALKDWLKKNDCRIEVVFVNGLSVSLVPKICAELIAKVPFAPVGVEQHLTLPKDSRFILLRRSSGQYYRNSLITGLVPLKQNGVAVQANDPRNMPVQIVYEWLPNLVAIGKLIKKATRQLQNDEKIDSGARGFIVIQGRGGEHLGTKIEERFLPNFPPCCLGVTLLSEIPSGNGQIILREGMDVATMNAMAHAADADHPSPGSEFGSEIPYLSINIITEP